LIGLTYTSELKGDIAEALRSITEVSYLKRMFRYDSSRRRWVAPLDIDSILECLYWTRRRDDAEVITQQNVDFALKELSLHGEDIYSKYAPRIISHSVKKLGFMPDFATYSSAYEAALTADGWL